MNKLSFNKEYWLINNGITPIIDSIDNSIYRKEKIIKILDRMNGINHDYRQSLLNHFKENFSIKTKLSIKK